MDQFDRTGAILMLISFWLAYTIHIHSLNNTQYIRLHTKIILYIECSMFNSKREQWYEWYCGLEQRSWNRTSYLNTIHSIFSLTLVALICDSWSQIQKTKNYYRWCPIRFVGWKLRWYRTAYAHSQMERR